MFQVKRMIRLSETDATGVLYFTNLMKFAVEAFEEYMEAKPGLFKEYLMPIVSAKGNYFTPLFRGDEIVLKMSVIRIGNSSVEIHTDVKKAGILAGKVEIIHVMLLKESGEKVVVPVELFSVTEIFGINKDILTRGDFKAGKEISEVGKNSRDI